MSVYIRGMEMPTDGNETIIRIQPNGTVLDQYGHHLAITAVPVPSHGDLIDRDAIRAEVKKHATPSDAWVFSFIRTSPTIIPEDEVV